MEDLDESAARMHPGTVKAALFEALRDAGSDGLDVGQMVEAVQVQSGTWACHKGLLCL